MSFQHHNGNSLLKGEANQQEDCLPMGSWFALRTRPRHEKKVAEMIEQSGMQAFLPFARQNRQWSQRVKEVDVPLFPGYVFASFTRSDWGRLMHLPGVVDGVRFGKMLAEVDPQELRSLQLAIASECVLEPHPYWPAGRTVRIAEGPLAGVEGKIVDDQGRPELLLSVTLLQRSVRARVPRQMLELPVPPLAGQQIQLLAGSPR